MASWITQFIGFTQDLLASVCDQFDLHNPTCIAAVGAVFVMLFIVTKLWTYASR